jgi:hypothetical protein
MPNQSEYWVWYDDEPRSILKSKIEQAVQHYQEKYGELPKECKFNGNMVNSSEDSAGDLLLEQLQFSTVTILTPVNIPRNNFWLGPVPVLFAPKA